MTKKILLLLSLLVVLACSTTSTKSLAILATQTATAQPTQTAAVTPGVCEVVTGVDGGTVNLRACGSTSCAVVDIVTEGKRLDIVTPGLWTQVTTEDGATGWINSNYCKGQ